MFASYADRPSTEKGRVGLLLVPFNNWFEVPGPLCYPPRFKSTLESDPRPKCLVHPPGRCRPFRLFLLLRGQTRRQTVPVRVTRWESWEVHVGYRDAFPGPRVVTLVQSSPVLQPF